MVPQIFIKEANVFASILKGTQKVVPNKKAQGESDFVTMLMCLIRIGEPFNTDLLITFNVPDKHTDEEDESVALG